MRIALFVATLLLASSLSAGVVFVSPQQGAQAIGSQIIEITTDAKNIDRVEFHVDGVLAGVARVPPYRIAFDFGTDLNPRTVRARVFSDRYQKSETAEVRTAALTAGESMNVDLVEVPMTIRSRRAIAPGDIRVRENGVEQTVRDVIRIRPPAHFAFVVDRSLSMNDGKLAAAVRAVDAAREQLREGDSASLVLFNHHVARPVSLSRGTTAVAQLRSTSPSGGTSLRDAVASVVSAANRRTYVLVISDGGDRNSLLGSDEALKKLSGAKTVLSAITLGSGSDFLDRAAAATGGRVVRASAASAERELGAMLGDINSRHTLVYQSSGTKGGWRTIAIAPKRQGIEIAAARTRYFAE